MRRSCCRAVPALDHVLAPRTTLPHRTRWSPLATFSGARRARKRPGVTRGGCGPATWSGREPGITACGCAHVTNGPPGRSDFRSSHSAFRGSCRVIFLWHGGEVVDAVVQRCGCRCGSRGRSVTSRGRWSSRCHRNRNGGTGTRDASGSRTARRSRVVLFVLYTGIQWESLPQELGFGPVRRAGGGWRSGRQPVCCSLTRGRVGHRPLWR